MQLIYLENILKLIYKISYSVCFFTEMGARSCSRVPDILGLLYSTIVILHSPAGGPCRRPQRPAASGSPGWPPGLQSACKYSRVGYFATQNVCFKLND